MRKSYSNYPFYRKYDIVSEVRTSEVFCYGFLYYHVQSDKNL